MNFIELNNITPNGKKIDRIQLFLDNSGIEYKAQYINSTGEKIFLGTFSLVDGNILFAETEDVLGVPHSTLKLLINWIDENVHHSIER